MPTQPLSKDQLRETLIVAARYVNSDQHYFNAEDKQSGQMSAYLAIANDMRMSHNPVRRRIAEAKRRYGWEPSDFVEECGIPEEDLTDLPDGLEVLRKRRKPNAEYIDKTRKSRIRVFPVRKEPFAIAFFGDPHLDNKGCNIDKLMEDVEIVKASGMRAVQMGDVLDNFHATGKLAAKQAANPMTISEGLSVARWLIRDSGVNWDAHVLGNHDKWLGPHGEHLMREWAKGTKVFDWMGQLVYNWGDGAFKVLAAHDFKGNSVYNPLHANFKRALQDGGSDLHVSAHKHNAAKADMPNGHRNTHYWHMRVKGYKDEDDYAYRGGFELQREGHSGVAVIDPNSDTKAGLCTLFLDISEGAEYFMALKARG